MASVLYRRLAQRKLALARLEEEAQGLTAQVRMRRERIAHAQGAGRDGEFNQDSDCAAPGVAWIQDFYFWSG